MTEPYQLNEYWFFEGCTNLRQKQSITEDFARLGYTSDFIAGADAFLAGNSVIDFSAGLGGVQRNLSG